jgi:hypothetical protein
MMDILAPLLGMALHGLRARRLLVMWAQWELLLIVTVILKAILAPLRGTGLHGLRANSQFVVIVQSEVPLIVQLVKMDLVHFLPGMVKSGPIVQP